jgi:hypothetical protein
MSTQTDVRIASSCLNIYFLPSSGMPPLKRATWRKATAGAAAGGDRDSRSPVSWRGVGGTKVAGELLGISDQLAARHAFADLRIKKERKAGHPPKFVGILVGILLPV